MSETQIKRKRAPGAGRKPKPGGKDKPFRVYLPDDLMKFARSQGGSEWVRKLIQREEIQSRIV